MASKSAQQEPGLSAEAIEESLEMCDKTLDRVKVLYEQYFLGIQKQPPTYLHSDIERKIRDLAQVHIRNTALRYRYATIQQKFASYNTYWRRTLRQIENGTYARNLSKISRNAARTGEDIPEEILASMPKRMREQVRRDREAALALAQRRGHESAFEDVGQTDKVGMLDESTEPRRPAVQRDARGAVRVTEDADFDVDAFFASVTEDLDEPTESGPPPVPEPALQPTPPAYRITPPFGTAVPRQTGQIPAQPPQRQTGQIPAQPAQRQTGQIPVQPPQRQTGPIPVQPPQRQTGPIPAQPPPVPQRQTGPIPAQQPLRGTSPLPPAPSQRTSLHPVETQQTEPQYARASSPLPTARTQPQPVQRPPVPPQRQSGPVPTQNPGVFAQQRAASPAPAAPERQTGPIPVRGAVPPPPRAPISPVATQKTEPGPHQPNLTPVATQRTEPGVVMPRGRGIIPTPPSGYPAQRPMPTPQPGIPAIPEIPRPNAMPSQAVRPNPIAPGSSMVRPTTPVEEMAGPFPRQHQRPDTDIEFNEQTPPSPTPPAARPRAAPPVSARSQPAAPKPPAPNPSGGAVMRPPPGMSDADVNALYAKYVKAKEMVGEQAGPGAYGKLLKTINQQAPKIMEQYKAKGVDFTVVVKDNQVIIRAKPKGGSGGG